MNSYYQHRSHFTCNRNNIEFVTHPCKNKNTRGGMTIFNSKPSCNCKIRSTFKSVNPFSDSRKNCDTYIHMHNGSKQKFMFQKRYT